MIWKINSKRQTGNEFERIAEQFLLEKGLRFVQRNFSCKLGELDLIMQDAEILVFVEVRYRKSSEFGGGAASVSATKQKRLIRTAQLYLQKKYGNRLPVCRFDVIAISGDNMNWIKNAFYVS